MQVKLVVLAVLLSATCCSALPTTLATDRARKERGQRVGRPEPPEEVDSDGAFESDMILLPQQLRQIEDEAKEVREGRGTRVKRKAASSEQYLWPDAVVPFWIDNNIPEEGQRAIERALKHWEDNTCLSFRRYSRATMTAVGHDSYLLFETGQGCSSTVGKNPGGGKQVVTIGPECYKLGTVAHEIGHALGFYHEQSRPDRDQFIKVRYDKIQRSGKKNFAKYGNNLVQDYDVPYDYGSAMHYGSKVYKKRAAKGFTIETPDPALEGVIGQRDSLSFYDIQLANKMYKCLGKCKDAKECFHGGYLGPRCTCVCPPGFTGEYCEALIPSSHGCGGLLEDSEGEFRTPGFPNNYGLNQVCRWLIKAPGASTIQLNFEQFAVEYSEDGLCAYDQVEVRLRGTQEAGSIYCQYGPGRVLEVEGDALYVEFRSDGDYTAPGFTASYIVTPPADVWSGWETWGPCSGGCGSGVRFRKRTCVADDKSRCAGLDIGNYDIETETCGAGMC